MSMLKVENLRKSYGGTEVLRGIGFTLEKGEVLCISVPPAAVKQRFCAV